jgi:16S rRNA (cytosine967-C5)-methyltransferase
MKIAKAKPVSTARRIALEVLRRIEAEGAFATLALTHAIERAPQLSAEDRALATTLVYGTVRFRRNLDFALAAHSRRPLNKIEPGLMRILRLTAYQLLFLERVPDWAAVDEAVTLASTLRGRRAAGFVNGVLRALVGAREHIDWPDPHLDPARALAIRLSFPDWMVQCWVEQFGPQRAEQFMAACNQPAPSWLRTNTLKTSPDELIELLSASGVTAHPSEYVPAAICAPFGQELRSAAAHDAGLFHVQDAAAQSVCHLLDPRPGERILDACAAPGGKTCTIAELMQNQGEIVAADAHPARCGLVRKLAERLGITCIQTVQADLSEPIPSTWGLFDRVLLDAPCSALGVLRRHPEAKWRLFPEDLAHLATVQRQLLDSVSHVVKPGGSLVYSVCTISHEEGSILIDTWLRDHTEFERADPLTGRHALWHKLIDADRCLHTWPDQHDMDGFFAVRLIHKQ